MNNRIALHEYFNHFLSLSYYLIGSDVYTVLTLAV